MSLGGNISSDGRFLAGVDWESPNLTIQDLITGGKRRLTNEKTSKDEWDETPVFSPDGKQIAYTWGINKDKTTFYELRIIGIDGSGGHVLYRKENGVYPYAYAWSPDGKSILAGETASSGPSAGLFKIDIETGDATLLVRGPGAFVSRDLKAQFYQSKNVLWVRNLETGEEKEVYRPTPPAEKFSYERGFAESPDGQRIAFKFGPSLIVVSRTGGEARELLKVRGSETFPNASWGTVAWTPDGRYLLFIQRGSELWRISADGGEPEKLGQLMELAIGLRVNPNGRRIAFNVGQRNKAAEVWGMENFLPAAQSAKTSVSRR